MKAHPHDKPLTFGDVVQSSYRACGKRKANGILRLAVKLRWIEFRGQRLYEIF
jgi:hypothetical protein